MKKTLTINLNNSVYHIDQDAFEALQSYLNDVESRLSPEERKEVMADIEARISELFTEKMPKGKDVINLAIVEEVMEILGKPNQFTEDDEESTGSMPPPPPRGERRGRKKFYRDPENAILGGVAAGLAALIGWDLVLVRILLVVILFLGYGTLIPLYIILWIIVPPATTIAQKLEMQGEEATAERIKQEFNNLKNYVESDKFKSNTSEVGIRIGEVFKAVFKVLFGVIGAVMGIIGFIMLGVLLFVLSFLIFEPAFFNGFMPEFSLLSSGWSIGLIITMLLIVGIPIFMLIYWAVKIISGRTTRSGSLGWIMLIVWFISIFIFAGLGARTALKLGKGEFSNWDIEWKIGDDNRADITEFRPVGTFTGIDVFGNVELDLVQDSGVPSVEVKGHPSVIHDLRTEVVDGVLKIYTSKFFVGREIKVNIVNANYDRINASGATDLRTFGKITAERLDITMTGASKADLKVSVSQDIKVDISGASNLEIEGVAYQLKSNSTGASKMDAEDLLVRNARIVGTGATQVNLNVTDSLEVDMTGASSVTNRGKPSYLKESKLGISNISIR